MNYNITNTEKFELVDYLLECPCLRTYQEVTNVVNNLPKELCNTILVGKSTREYLLNVVNTCLSFDNGLNELIETVKFHDKDTVAYEKLRNFLNKLVKNEASIEFINAKNKSQNEIANTTDLKETEQKLWTDLPNPEYNTLYGRETEVLSVLDLLTNGDKYPIVTITSIGGMGKTALAREVIERLKSSKGFERIIWQSAKLEEYRFDRIREIETPLFSLDELINKVGIAFGELFHSGMPLEKRLDIVKQLVKKNSTLIVIDNLETVPEADEVVNKLFQLLTPSKLLLTSREQPSLGNSEILEINGLDEKASIELMKSDAKRLGLEKFSSLSSEYIREIFVSTGGAPLAIKLVIAQLSTSKPLDDLLEQLNFRTIIPKTTPEKAFVEMYTYIYHRIWNQLSKPARRIAIVIADWPQFIPRDALERVTKFSKAGISEGLEQLNRFNLLETNGEIISSQVMYNIHPLTRSFIKNDLPTIINRTIKKKAENEKGN